LDSVPPADTSAVPPDSARAEYRLERLSASGEARSLYRMEPSDSARARGHKDPAIHFVKASSIVLQWDEGEVRAMEVSGQTEGVHAEPAVAPPDSARADSTSAVTHTSGVRADTAATGAATPRLAPRAVGSQGLPRAARRIAFDLAAAPSGRGARVRRRRAGRGP
jgi:hypothetical protein